MGGETIGDRIGESDLTEKENKRTVAKDCVRCR